MTDDEVVGGEDKRVFLGEVIGHNLAHSVLARADAIDRLVGEDGQLARLFVPPEPPPGHNQGGTHQRNRTREWIHVGDVLSRYTGFLA